MGDESRQTSSRPRGSGGKNGRLSLQLEDDESYKAGVPGAAINSAYSDPLGPLPQRPRTSAGNRQQDDDFADEEIGDDLLPE